ncbi:MAG: surfeit locus 1 family protein [Acetobacteraceae bacterium]|nr:surfeit locus 1 family protein [Acetobacteraceae bacterium]
MKLGSRMFAPRPLTTALTIVMLAVLVSLGRWQLRRADQKRALYDAFDRGTDATRSIDLRTPTVPRYQHVEAQGSYDASRQILVDNMTDMNGHAGYFVITPLSVAGGGWLLVNRGWVPVGASRADLPAVDVPAGVRRVRGRADHLPTPGIQLGARAVLHPPYPVVANFPSHAEIEGLLHESSWAGATDLVLLDADQPDGYVRQWQPPGFPPLRNVAYAVQWFGLALALGIIYLVTNLRRATDHEAAV